MQNLAVKTYPVEIPELKVVEQPLYLVGTQVVSLGRENSWEAFKDDLSALYTCNSRWLGGRFVSWTLEALGPRGLQKKRGGWMDAETGLYIYGGRGVQN